MTEFIRLPKIEIERVPETYNQCSNCYCYVANGVAQCHGLQPECVLHNCQYYQPMYHIKEKENE